MPSISFVQVALESLLPIALRLVLLFASRSYLLRSLYHDLKDLSASEVDITTAPHHSAQDDDIELDSLPTPSSSASATSKAHGMLTRKRTFHSTLSRTLFSITFTESCTLFILLMLQGLDILHPQTRLLNWTWSIAVLLLSIVVLIPLSYSLVLSYRSASVSQTLQRPSPARLFMTMLPVGLFLFSLSFVPLPPSFSSHSMLASPFAKILARLIVVGTVILGLLSGFGAVSNAWMFFPRISGEKKPQPTEEDIRVAERGLERVREDIAERRRELERLEASQPKSDATWYSGFMPSFSGSSQSTATSQELQGLLALEQQMAGNLSHLRSERARVKFDQTLRGKLFKWGGRIFAVYCVYRIGISIINLILPAHNITPGSSESSSSARMDILTIILAHLVSVIPWVHLPTNTEDISVIARQISLGLVGLIILSSIRMVLRGVARVLRVTSKNLGASLMLLILAQLMGLYLLSTLIQLRTSFPPPPPRTDTEPDNGIINLFSTLPEFQVFGSLFDGSFLLAAVVSVVVLWFDERINGGGFVNGV
ncbi:hypothetical protein K474DRAFT_1713534 [Panus rudis PR-1116 ss-1]|nr:hypothetical protein K474DRAFT_1713534 [Panus rudis PR-1116 ss-1]